MEEEYKYLIRSRNAHNNKHNIESAYYGDDGKFITNVFKSKNQAGKYFNINPAYVYFVCSEKDGYEYTFSGKILKNVTFCYTDKEPDTFIKDKRLLKKEQIQN